MKSKFVYSIFACIVSMPVLCSSVQAHHGGQVEFQVGVEGSLTGTVTDFVFRFPHVVIYADVTDDNGATRSWALNTRWTPTILRMHGWTRDSVKPGDTVAVTYSPHVTEPTVVNMRTIEVNGEELPLEF